MDDFHLLFAKCGFINYYFKISIDVHRKNLETEDHLKLSQVFKNVKIFEIQYAVPEILRRTAPVSIIFLRAWQRVKNLCRFLNLHRLDYYFDRLTGSFFRSKYGSGDRQTGFFPVDRYCRLVRLPSPAWISIHLGQIYYFESLIKSTKKRYFRLSSELSGWRAQLQIIIILFL